MEWDNQQNNIPLQKTQNAGWNVESGKITGLIGSGNNAKNSLIYLVLKWSFYSALAITIIVGCNYLCFRDAENKVPNITGDLKIIWEIVTPIITLALGYAFGKSEQ